MKKYVLDSSFFVVSRNYYPGTFLSFWEKMDELVANETVSSVQEVSEELERYGGEQEHLLIWIKENKHLFTQPTIEEQQGVREIFSIADFRKLIEEREQMFGRPKADPFVIAKAGATSGVVVTGELPAKRNNKNQIQGEPKIPDVCANFKISCITPQQFMEEQGWRF